MRVLTLNANLKGVGTYQRCFYFSRELARHGHDVTMVTVSRDSTFRPRIYHKREWVGHSPQPVGQGPWVRMIEGPKLGYKWLPGWGSGPLDIWLRLKEILTGGYDIVYGFEYQPNVSWPVYLTKPLKRYRFYSDWCDWHAGVSNRFRGWRLAHKIDCFLEEQIRLIAHRVTTNSSLLRQRAIEIGVEEDRVIFVAQGIDPDYIKPSDCRTARKQLGLPPDVPLIGTVTDSDWRENLDVFRGVQSRVPSARLLVIGQQVEGLEEYARQKGIGEAVIEIGWVSDEDYPLYLASADVLFLLMTNDLRDQGRWPGKINDYLGAGRATVITNAGDAAAFVQQHGAGLVCDDPEEMAVQIGDLLGDDGARNHYGEQARKAAITRLDWQVLGGLINQVIAE